MADGRLGGGLGTIFSFFLGLMVATFIGVGVYTFHPPPEDFQARIQDLDRRVESIRRATPPDELTSADRDRIQSLAERRDELVDAAQAAREPWGRTTSIILIAFATIAMAVSLVRADRLPVVSNGLLLGGVFTMIYGVGWIVATDTAITRFIVITVALVITLALGYVRFVRARTTSAAPAGPTLPHGDGFADIERRVRDLEQRLDDAASALGHGRGSGEGTR